MSNDNGDTQWSHPKMNPESPPSREVLTSFLPILPLSLCLYQPTYDLHTHTLNTMTSEITSDGNSEHNQLPVWVFPGYDIFLLLTSTLKTTTVTAEFRVLPARYVLRILGVGGSTHLGTPEKKRAGASHKEQSRTEQLWDQW